MTKSDILHLLLLLLVVAVAIARFRWPGMRYRKFDWRLFKGGKPKKR
jgi:hypothetical protein